MRRCRTRRRAIATLVSERASRERFDRQVGSTCPYTVRRRPRHRSGSHRLPFVLPVGWTFIEKSCGLSVHLILSFSRGQVRLDTLGTQDGSNRFDPLFIRFALGPERGLKPAAFVVLIPGV